MTRLTELTRYDEAQSHFSKDALWALFDGSRERLNIAHECVDRHAGQGREAVLIAHADGRDERIGFDELAARSAQIAHWLDTQGIGRGERVAIMLEPSLAFYASLFGIMKAGAIAVPLFTLFGPDGLRLRVEDCQPRLLLCAEDKLEVARASGVPRVMTGQALLDACADQRRHYQSDTSADDLALFQYTSGTTRELPEAVQHRHRSVVTVAIAALYGTGVRPGDRFMCPSSPAWGHGLAHGTLGPLGLGVTIASYAGAFDARRLLLALRDYRINNLSAAATHYRMMRQSQLAAAGTPEALAPDDFAIHKLSFTGEPMDSETATWVERFFGRPACSIYGSTEVGVILTQYPGADDFEVKRGALGRPVPGIDVEVLDEQGKPCPPGVTGQIMLRRRDGWFAIKDLGHRDADGDFYHDGRADDVIISAGYTISAKEVEDALLRHPEVREAAVVGSPDSLRGLVVKAFVVPYEHPDPARREARVEALQAHVRQTLSAHEYPRRIEFVDALPKTPAGKVNRRVLREQEASAAAEAARP
ncbi:MAG: acyl-CoA synthetase [Gammaproteobacteria bacterium]|nr:acyl-CoA synthetase [Gammaproteobacteria bacterium]